ncbi:MAG: CAP domain-containing protein [Clostridia bacterium]|nr:CAP domain-containing protein [Clostridia bacterium]
MTHSRKKSRAALAAALWLALAPAALAQNDAAAESATAFDAHYTTAFQSAQEINAGNLLNSDRARYGLSPLVIDPELSRIARIKSADMRDNHYFAHTSPTYGDVRQMLTQFGYSYAAAGENIAHHRDVDKAQAALISSPGHRRNVLSRACTKVGIGIALDENGYVYLTQIFCR